MRNIVIPSHLQIAKTSAELIVVLQALIDEYKIEKLLLCHGLYTRDSEALMIAEQFDPLVDLCLVDDKAIGDLLQSPSTQHYDCVIGLGGGKVLDYAKYLSAKISAKFISIPTLISHDGICSPVAVLRGQSLAAVMPKALLIPLYMIKASDVDHIKSGVGDLISNLSAVDDWYLAAQHSNESVDDFAIMLAKNSAMNIILQLESFMARGLDYQWALYDDEFLEALVEALALSGIAMSIAGSSRPCSGAEHLISHAIDKLFGHGVKASHGIQVLLATVFLEGYRANQERKQRLEKILSYFHFPETFAAIGVHDMQAIIELAPKMRPDRFSILSLELDLLPNASEQGLRGRRN